MGDSKLLDCRISLRENHGDAYERCVNSGSGDPGGDLRVVEQLVSDRGLR
jgi:hypothetical protein